MLSIYAIYPSFCLSIYFSFFLSFLPSFSFFLFVSTLSLHLVYSFVVTARLWLHQEVGWTPPKVGRLKSATARYGGANATADVSGDGWVERTVDEAAVRKAYRALALKVWLDFMPLCLLLVVGGDVFGCCV